MTHKLDRPIWNALTTCHADFAQNAGAARRYREDFAPFAATPDDGPESLDDLFALVPPGSGVALFTTDKLTLPARLVPVHRGLAAQMILDAPPRPGRLAAWRELSAADVPAMTALVGLTKPGPFAARTIELGRYLGIFEGARLVAMAGERMRLDGFVEISAVCTDPAARGHGHAGALTLALAVAAFARGEIPFLHAFADNAPALTLYRKLGFRQRTTLHLVVVRRADGS